MTNLEEVEPEDEPRTYREQPFRSRMLVAVAGSAMHFLMAFVLLWTLVTFVGVARTDQVQIQGFVPVAGRTGPAAVAGLRPGDVVVSVDGRPVGGNVDTLTSVIHDHPGVPVAVVVERAGADRTVTVTPANGRVAGEPGSGAPPGTAPYGVIGVDLGAPLQRSDPLAAAGRATVDLGRFTWASVTGVVHLFSPASVAQRFNQVTSPRAAEQAAANGTRVQSILGAVRTADQAAHAGIGDLLLVLISINIFVGVFNLFPMLPLDGGHVLIAVYERIRTGRRRTPYHADVAKLMPFTWLMLAFLGILFVTSLTVDLAHPMPNPFG